MLLPMDDRHWLHDNDSKLAGSIVSVVAVGRCSGWVVVADEIIKKSSSRLWFFL